MLLSILFISCIQLDFFWQKIYCQWKLSYTFCGGGNFQFVYYFCKRLFFHLWITLSSSSFSWNVNKSNDKPMLKTKINLTASLCKMKKTITKLILRIKCFVSSVVVICSICFEFDMWLSYYISCKYFRICLTDLSFAWVLMWWKNNSSLFFSFCNIETLCDGWSKKHNDFMLLQP